jgi:Plavaka transposase
LREAGSSGIFMTSGDGLTRRNHPLLACVVEDYPEQVLTTCIPTGQCPTCTKPHNELGEFNPNEVPEPRDLILILEALDSFDDNPGDYLKTCKEAGIKPVIDPFWKELPYANVYRSITPDILHQLYQGILKHLVEWVKQSCGVLEVDARCRRLPPNHNIRHFVKGISSLSRVTGQEHDQMSRILLGLVIDCPLPGGLSNVRLVRAVRALLDFIYLAQYPVHTDETLSLLDDALELFHDNKNIFIDLGLRDSFNIPKLHSAKHYTQYIRLYGTLDNYNTEYTERLHIDLAKDAYRATNHKDEFSQMTLWLERKEKIFRHRQYIIWRLEGSPDSETVGRRDWTPPGLELDCHISLSIHPTVRAVTLDNLELKYGATHFRTALQRYVSLINHPNMLRAELERQLDNVRIPFTRLPVWHRIKFLRKDPVTDKKSTADSIHCRPSQVQKQGILPSRFDTALVNDGTGEDTGAEGERFIHYSCFKT